MYKFRFSSIFFLLLLLFLVFHRLAGFEFSMYNTIISIERERGRERKRERECGTKESLAKVKLDLASYVHMYISITSRCHSNNRRELYDQRIILIRFFRSKSQMTFHAASTRSIELSLCDQFIRKIDEVLSKKKKNDVVWF